MPVNSRTPARPAPCCRLLIDLGERRRRRRVLEPPGDRRREVDDAIEILVVDLVGGVGRLVVVGVRAGEEVQRRDARRVEGGDVGRLIRIFLHREVEAGGDVGLLDDLAPTPGSMPVACTVSLLSCIRPTMSKFR